MKLSAIFFDRDGTVIFDKHYLKDPAGVELIPGVAAALLKLAEHGIDAFLVSNQSGIGRGFFTAADLDACQFRLNELLRKKGVHFKDTCFCPHSPEDNCACRKPSIGMWQRLCEKYELDPAKCVMIGDKEEDLIFGKNCGMPISVLVLTGKGMKTAAKLGLNIDAATHNITSFNQLLGMHDNLLGSNYYLAKNALNAVQGLLALDDDIT